MQKINSSSSVPSVLGNDAFSEESTLESFFAKKANDRKKNNDLSGSELFCAAQQIVFTCLQAEKGARGGVHSGDIPTRLQLRGENRAADTEINTIRALPAAFQLHQEPGLLPNGATDRQVIKEPLKHQAVDTGILTQEKANTHTTKSNVNETFHLNDRSSFPLVAGSSDSVHLFTKPAEVSTKQKTVKHVHAEPLPAPLQSASEPGFRFQFSQWGHGKHVTINALPDQIMFQPSDNQVHERMASQWDDKNRPMHWQLEEKEHSEQGQKHPHWIWHEEDEA